SRPRRRGRCVDRAVGADPRGRWGRDPRGRCVRRAVAPRERARARAAGLSSAFGVRDNTRGAVRSGLDEGAMDIRRTIALVIASLGSLLGVVARLVLLGGALAQLVPVAGFLVAPFVDPSLPERRGSRRASRVWVAASNAA